jgi:hypothetical protein
MTKHDRTEAPAALLKLIGKHAGSDGACTATNDELAAELGISKRTLQRRLKLLEKLELLSFTQTSAGRELRVTHDVTPSAVTPPVDTPTGPEAADAGGMTRRDVEQLGWRCVTWEPPRLTPTSWDASGAVQSQTMSAGRLIAERHAPDGRVVRVHATSLEGLAAELSAGESRMTSMLPPKMRDVFGPADDVDPHPGPGFEKVVV